MRFYYRNLACQFSVSYPLGTELELNFDSYYTVLQIYFLICFDFVVLLLFYCLCVSRRLLFHLSITEWVKTRVVIVPLYRMWIKVLSDLLLSLKVLVSLLFLIEHLLFLALGSWYWRPSNIYLLIICVKLTSPNVTILSW